ncbi:MAG: sporulation protein YtxC [Oscillospiraceae bacterium]
MEQIIIKADEDLKEIENMPHKNIADVAEMLARWIIEHYQNKYIYNIIISRFENLSEFEREDINSRVSNSINPIEQELYKNIVKNELMNCFKNSNILNLEGFLMFRLNQYRDELEFIVEECGYEYMALKEYDDIIDILKYFKDITNSDDFQ